MPTINGDRPSCRANTGINGTTEPVPEFFRGKHQMKKKPMTNYQLRCYIFKRLDIVPCTA